MEILSIEDDIKLAVEINDIAFTKRTGDDFHDFGP
jgi:hypothetical protein